MFLPDETNSTGREGELKDSKFSAVKSFKSEVQGRLKGSDDVRWLLRKHPDWAFWSCPISDNQNCLVLTLKFANGLPVSSL